MVMLTNRSVKAREMRKNFIMRLCIVNFLTMFYSFSVLL